MTAPTSPSRPPSEGADLLLALGRHRRILWRWPLAAAVVATVVSLLLPKSFTGVTRILPPQQGGGTAAALLGQLGGLGSLAGALGGGLGLKNPAELYMGMLKSDAVADALIQRFKLQELYDEKYLVDVRKRLRRDSTFAVDPKSGIISISAEAHTPQLAADMANAYVEELHKLTNTLAVSDAAQRRVFFERQLQQTKEKLADAEVKLRQAIESGGLVSVDAQSRATVETVARLRATISAREIQLDAMRAYAAESNPERQRAEQELGSIRRELARLESGGGLREGPGLEPGKGSPAGVANIRLLREVKYQEVLFELMARQYELARVEEAKEAPLIQVLDRATPPEKKTSPRRALIVLATFLVVLLAAVAVALGREELARIHGDPPRAARLAALRETWLRRGNGG